MNSDELHLPAECLTKPVETLGLPTEYIPTPKAVPAANQLALFLTVVAQTAKGNMPRLTAYGWNQALFILADMKSSAEFNASVRENAALYSAMLTPDRFRSNIFSTIDFEYDLEETDHAWFEAMTPAQLLSLVCVFNQSEEVNIADESALRKLLSGIFDMPLECVFSDDPAATDLWEMVLLEKVSDKLYRAHFDYNNKHMAKLGIAVLNNGDVYSASFETMEDRFLIEPESNLKRYLFNIALPVVFKAIESVDA